jgi:hypothetical protein
MALLQDGVKFAAIKTGAAVMLRSKGMWMLLMCAAITVFAGCTHDIRPVVKDQGLYITKIKDEQVQIVASQQFQQLTLQDVPLKSSNWKWQKFNVAIGKTLTDGVYSYVRSTFDHTTIGDTKDAGIAGFTVVLSNASVDLWIDDDSSFASQMVLAPTYYMNTVDAQAKVTLTGNLLLPSGESRPLQITGKGLKNLKPASMDSEVIEEVTGLAAADAAKQVVDLIRGARGSKPAQ